MLEVEVLLVVLPYVASARIIMAGPGVPSLLAMVWSWSVSPTIELSVFRFRVVMRLGAPPVPITSGNRIS
jgi:hypothetical protein